MQTLESQISLDALLEQAEKQGEVRVRREDGLTFVIKPETQSSPLDVEGVNLNLSAGEIVEFIAQGRKSA